jgi:hypothetical protein
VSRPGDAELQALLGHLDAAEALLKDRAVCITLGERRVNSSLALTALYGLRSLLEGDRAGAVEDLGTVAEELAARSSLVP